MAEEELTRSELLDKVEELRRRIAEMERQEIARRQAEKSRLDAALAEQRKVEEELQLRYAQLKASEEELKQTRRLLADAQAKTEELQSQLSTTEKLLHESEGHYRHLAENFPGLLAIQDVQAKKYVFWNRDLGWAGYTIDEWNELSAEAKKRLIHPDDLNRFLKAFQEWEKINYYQPLRLTYRLRHKNGEFRWIDAFIFKEFTEDGQVIAQVELSWDITAQKELEDRIKELEGKLQILSQSAGGLVCVTDTDERFLFASPAFCETFGRREEELVGKKFSPPVHQDDFQSSLQAAEALRSEPHHAVLEQRVLTKDGWRWFRWEKTAQLDSAGRIERITTVGTDITDRRRLEEELKGLKAEFDRRVEQRIAEQAELNSRLLKQLEELKRSEAEALAGRARLHTLVSALRVGIFDLDDSGEIHRVKPDMLAILNLSEPEVMETIHETERAVEAARRTRVNLQMLLDALDDLIIVADAQGRIQFANQAARRRLGYSDEEIGQRNVIELTPPNRRDEAAAILNDAVKGRGRVHSIPMLAKDKTLLPVETAVALGRWDDATAVIYAARDITERQAAERRRVTAERRYRLAAEEAPVGVAVIQDDMVRYANPYLGQLLEYSPDEIDDWSTAELEAVVHPHDREVFVRFCRQSQTKVRDAVRHCIWRAVTRSGQVKHLLHFAKPVNYEGRPAELATFVDLTPIRRQLVERTPGPAARTAQAEREALELLAGSVAHDFNELLTIITGHTDMSLMSVHEGDPIRRHLESINKAAQQSSELTWKLLTFAGRSDWNPRPVQMNDLLAGTFNILQRVLGRGVSLEIQPGEDIGVVRIDPDLFEQVFINLAANAREACPEGGKVVIRTESVTIAEGEPAPDPVPPGRWVRVSFTDNGAGIPTEILPRIFDPFFTTKTEKGAGMGLATALGVVRKSGGWMFAESQVGQGTTIRIYLPPAPAEAPAEAPPPARTKPKGLGETVLLVEDDDAVREMAAQILKWHGYRVTGARSGQEALEIAERMTEPVDVVISDVYMPNMDGVELVERLRRIWGGVKVMFMSGATASRPVDPNIPLLKKPFPPKELVSRVAELLAQ